MLNSFLIVHSCRFSLHIAAKVMIVYVICGSSKDTFTEFAFAARIHHALSSNCKIFGPFSNEWLIVMNGGYSLIESSFRFPVLDSFVRLSDNCDKQFKMH